MADPIVFLGKYLAGKALGVAGSAMRDLAAAPPNQFEEIRQRNGAEATFEFTLALERLEQKHARVAEELRGKITEREAGALFTQLLGAAADSSTRERMRMLCAALAGVLLPNFDAETRSRVSRAVMQLEASDVLELRKLYMVERAPGFAPSLQMTPALEPLVLAGCVRDQSSLAGHPAVATTERGHAVLAALEVWEPEPSSATG